MNRALALFLAIIGGAAVALAVLMLATGAAVGILWFVFGDDPWPAWFEPVANTVVSVIGIVLWAGFAWLIWLRLKRI